MDQCVATYGINAATQRDEKTNSSGWCNGHEDHEETHRCTRVSNTALFTSTPGGERANQSPPCARATFVSRNYGIPAHAYSWTFPCAGGITKPWRDSTAIIDPKGEFFEDDDAHQGLRSCGPAHSCLLRQRSRQCAGAGSCARDGTNSRSRSRAGVTADTSFYAGRD